ncbi:glycosyltransferase family 4 protein [Aegicerativicinus sediminis]|uniref:glycosyltransferase family 4 protein n=1 Tax=Aegicerativicinus sediminis TaxID=2893202 RepID=UPI001E5095C2|nr:glycosyltransferase family 4 protein [Aegicerativicinus sediminis]
MDRFTKIAIYSGEIPSTTFIERLILGLSQRQFQLHVFGLVKTYPKNSPNVKVVGYRNNKFSKGLHLLKFTILLRLFQPKHKQKLDAWLKSKNRHTKRYKLNFYPVLWNTPHIFHIQWAKSLEDWMWLKEFGVKIVLSLRGAHINYSPIADLQLAESYRRNFPKVDGFHAVSNAIATEALKYGAHPKNIKVVYSGIDIKPSNTSVHEKNRYFQVVSVGRNHWKKGYNYALDAIKIVTETYPDVHYSLIGLSDNIEYIYQIKDLGIEKNVSILPILSQMDVLDRMARADLMLLSSVEEGIANVVLEAMAMGTLVLSTDCGGMSELIKDGENGFLVPIRFPELMAQKILHCISFEKNKKAVIIDNAKVSIKQNHNLEGMVDGMIELYNQVLNEA